MPRPANGLVTEDVIRGTGYIPGHSTTPQVGHRVLCPRKDPEYLR
jgi:hypothetical protein